MRVASDQAWVSNTEASSISPTPSVRATPTVVGAQRYPPLTIATGSGIAIPVVAGGEEPVVP